MKCVASVINHACGTAALRPIVALSTPAQQLDALPGMMQRNKTCHLFLLFGDHIVLLYCMHTVPKSVSAVLHVPISGPKALSLPQNKQKNLSVLFVRRCTFFFLSNEPMCK